MCFSAEADLVAGVVVGAVAIDALRQVRRPQQLPLALIPAVFSAHQLIEAAVWWSHDGTVSAQVGDAATWAYLAIALWLLPPLVPLAMYLEEPVAWRRRALAALLAIGLLVAAAFIRVTADGPVCSVAREHHLFYDIGLQRDVVLTLLYVAATCGAMLLSSSRPIQLYGVVNLAAVGILALIQQTAVISFWCVWAALTSVLIAVHLRRADRAPVRGDNEVLRRPQHR